MSSSEIFTCPILGNSEKLPEDQLLSIQDVLMYCNHIREERKSNVQFEPSFSEIAKTVASDKSTSSAESSTYEPSYRQKRNVNTGGNHNQNRIELKETALSCQRYNISSRAGAALVTSTSIDSGLHTKIGRKLITDKNKIQCLLPNADDLIMENFLHHRAYILEVPINVKTIGLLEYHEG
ncbi:hypothetical protein HHI36_015096 [Cryptolaemus montrouzieri]|uniref:Uncharacterized protein n=1 Tax=Cryptolaemus montrouzieri TaxID=559131 RepID=A0ABD2N4K7_9CUCU